MWLFLVLPGVGNNSRFGESNSRLGPNKFPVGGATGILRQATDFATCFRRQTAVLWPESTKFPVMTGISGNLAAAA
jgi:hypothetical protein